MNKERKRALPASDRSMDVESEVRSQIFFFPKRNPPVTVRATSLEEAERLLETNNKEV